MASHYTWEPNVAWRDRRWIGTTSWEDLDDAARKHVGLPGVAIPSIRVGLSWLMMARGMRRHRDHLLVPRFVGRCILNTLNRYAMPTEVATPQTRLALAVHALGFPANVSAAAVDAREKGLDLVEDAPCGPLKREALHPHTLGRFIGFAKVLPILKGAYFASKDEGLLQAMRTERSKTSAWSWLVGVSMARVRRRRTSRGYSALADAAYELYPAAAGDNGPLRAQFLHGLGLLERFSQQSWQRAELAKKRLGDEIQTPPDARIPYVGAVSTHHDPAAWQKHGFDGGEYHVDVNGNTFRPDYQPRRLVPFNPRIPLQDFESLIQDIAARAHR